MKCEYFTIFTFVSIILQVFNTCIQMLKKNTHLVAILKNLDSFVANNRQGVQFNKQFVGLINKLID